MLGASLPSRAEDDMSLFETCRRWLDGRRRSRETGAALVEYALLIAFIAVLCIAAVGLVGDWALETLDSTGDRL